MTDRKDVYLDGLRFVITGIAGPGQYDVFDGSGKQVGYIRPRYAMITRTAGAKRYMKLTRQGMAVSIPEKNGITA
jgi:hypothetical protein